VTVTSTAASPEAASREVSLELIGLSRRFGSVVALDGLTFSVPPGEVFGFLGPNGAGKTTTMRAIFGVVALDAGEVRWRGEPVTEEDRRRFGYMPEERGLYPSMQILEQLEYLGRLHDMTAASARDAARNWIKRLGLEGRESAKLEALSHGNQQRVQLAAAIIAYALSYTVIYADGANVFYKVLGFLPPTAPIAMPVLYAAGDVPGWQAAISAALVAAGTVWMARTAATIYGRSILRTGSRVRLRQVLTRGEAA
jgi:ABC-type transport system involved in cytochrome c biogenesis ATPase subunit